MERRAEVGVEGAHFLHLFRCCRLLEPFADEPGVIAAPHQRSESLFGYKSGRTGVAEALARAFDEADEATALEYEMTGKLRRQKLDARRGQALESIRHIL